MKKALFMTTVGLLLAAGAALGQDVRYNFDKNADFSKFKTYKWVTIKDAAKVNDLTQGKKLPVVYDSVGKDTFYKSLDCLAPLGLMVSFGQSSGAVGPVDIGILAGKGSLFLTRPTLNTYTASREDLLTAARELFEVVQSGAVKIAINQTYPLRDAARAHRDLEGRKTTGSTVLTV